MRQIKFRAWSYLTKSISPAVSFQKWCYSDWGFHEDPLNKQYMELMQFTGGIDVNGKEIYEGDIVEFGLKTKVGLVAWTGVMEFDESVGQFGVHAKTNFEVPDHQANTPRPKVLGNIYENPELIPKN